MHKKQACLNWATDCFFLNTPHDQQEQQAPLTQKASCSASFLDTTKMLTRRVWLKVLGRVSPKRTQGWLAWPAMHNISTSEHPTLIAHCRD
jgi:hypothetical protein